MANNAFRRYIWLLDLISRWGYISFDDINKEWQRSPLNGTGEPLPERTFFNHKAAIEDIFGIEIRNDRALGFYISGDTILGGSETADWLLNSLCLNNVLRENSDMKDRILLEDIPSGRKFLTEIISAMRSCRTLSLTYQSFNHPEPHSFNVRPYCVKLFKQRWYMLGDSDLGLRIYSLDRAVDMEALDIPYELPKDFDAEGFFWNYFGIIIGGGGTVQEVLLKVRNDQAKYFRSLPLHRSQEVLVSEDREITLKKYSHWKGGFGLNDDDCTVFRYRLVPTFDFWQEILSHGDAVEVLAPNDLRDWVANAAENMNGIYNGSPSVILNEVKNL